MCPSSPPRNYKSRATSGQCLATNVSLGKSSNATYYSVPPWASVTSKSRSIRSSPDLPSIKQFSYNQIRGGFCLFASTTDYPFSQLSSMRRGTEVVQSKFLAVLRKARSKAACLVDLQQRRLGRRASLPALERCIARKVRAGNDGVGGRLPRLRQRWPARYLPSKRRRGSRLSSASARRPRALSQQWRRNVSRCDLRSGDRRQWPLRNGCSRRRL